MIALDTNILVYAEALDDAAGRPSRIRKLMESLTDGTTIVPMQALAEFMNVCRRKTILSMENAVVQVEQYLALFVCPPTVPGDIINAAQTAERYRLAYFDALICAVASRAGATVLLSEDMADGMEIDGLRIVNPFSAGNEGLIAELIG